MANYNYSRTAHTINSLINDFRDDIIDSVAKAFPTAKRMPSMGFIAQEITLSELDAKVRVTYALIDEGLRISVIAFPIDSLLRHIPLANSQVFDFSTEDKTIVRTVVSTIHERIKNFEARR